MPNFCVFVQSSSFFLLLYPTIKQEPKILEKHFLKISDNVFVNHYLENKNVNNRFDQKRRKQRC